MGKGRVDLFLGGETGLSETAEWSVTGSQAEAEFGAKVDLLAEMDAVARALDPRVVQVSAGLASREIIPRFSRASEISGKL